MLCHVVLPRPQNQTLPYTALSCEVESDFEDEEARHGTTWYPNSLIKQSREERNEMKWNWMEKKRKRQQ